VKEARVRPFRFGVNALVAGSAAEWIALARRLEELGYSTLCLPDHLTDRLAPLPALATAAAVTSQLRIGTVVLNNDFRHPVVLAREAATVDMLSEGRLELGLGAGYMKTEYEQAGMRFDRGGVRVDRLGETVTIVTRLFEGEPVTFRGRHYQVSEHTIHPRPVQRPRPPILIGGNGPRLLTLAATEADIVALSGITFGGGGLQRDMAGFRADGVDERVRLVREAAGARFEQLELSALVQRVTVTEDRRGAAEELAQRRPGLTVEDILESPFVLLGSIDEIVDQLVARRRRWGISYYVVFRPAVDVFAPIVDRLTGL
jgi:probable F420-dependent oxidoreductase